MLNSVADKDEIKAEVRVAVREAVTEGITGFFERMFSPAENKQPDVYSENLLAVLSGYLYMSIKELGYESAKLRAIMQKIELKINTHSPDEAIEAYKKCKEEILPVIIAGIVVPPEYDCLKISELEFSNSRMRARTTNALEKNKIIYIKDFRNNDVEIEKVRNLGAGTVKEFKAAIRRTIGVISKESQETVTDNAATVPPIITREHQIGGITIPEELLGKRVDNLTYTSNISRTKIVNRLKNGYNIVYLRDFFNDEIPSISKIFSPNGKKSFLQTLQRTLNR